MAHAPGWVNMIDPAYSDALRGTLNRARRGEALFTQSIGYNTFATSGKRAFLGTGYVPTPNPVPTIRFSARQNGLINPYQWTAFCVCKLPALTTGVGNEQITWLMRSRNSTTSEFSINLALHQGTGNIIFYETGVAPPGTPIRYSVAGDFRNKSTPTLIIVTFSVEHGIGVFRNAVGIGRSADNRPPDTPSSSGYSMLTNLNGQAGICGFLNLDLSAAENIGYRQSMEKYLMSAYGIV